MIKFTKFSLLFLMFLCVSLNSFAAEEFLPEAEEKRAQNLFLQVKCLACAGQVIESSNTEVSFEMRKLIRQQILSGLSDDQIKQYLVDNYGAQILTSPPVNQETALLWFLPLIFAVIGFLGFAIFFFRKKS